MFEGKRCKDKLGYTYSYVLDNHAIPRDMYIGHGITDLKIEDPPAFPKVMMVWNGLSTVKVKRVVFAKIDKGYLAWKFAETFEQAKLERDATTWDCAEDIPLELPKKEVTLQEIADMMGIPVEQLRIKE